MRVKINFEVDASDIDKVYDALSLLKKGLVDDFNKAHDELLGELDEDNFAGKWMFNNYDLEIEL